MIPTLLQGMGHNIRHPQHHLHQGTQHQKGTLHHQGMVEDTLTITITTALVVIRVISMMGTLRRRLLLNLILLHRFTTVSTIIKIMAVSLS